MAIKKQYFKTKPEVKVTLSLPKTAVKGAKKVEVFGDFTNWAEGIKMTKQKDGSYKTSVTLNPEAEYQFRYLIDNVTWENDWKADKYISNGVSGEENSVVVL
ncbi:MAG: isoamylase early set domain-containing protein [Bacteroidota bacterium]